MSQDEMFPLEILKKCVCPVLVAKLCFNLSRKVSQKWLDDLQKRERERERRGGEND